MPRSSRHKSHKRSSKDEKEYDSASEEDVKVKEGERSGKEEKDKVSRVLEHSVEKRKHSRPGKENKDSTGYGNGDASEEHASSKRRKERGDASDRWNDSGDGRGTKKETRGESSRIDFEKGEKGKEMKGLGDSKSRSIKRHESGGEKEEVDVVSVEEKDEKRSSAKVESKRKAEKDSGRWESKDSKEKDRGEKRGQELKRQDEVKGADCDLIKKLTEPEEVGKDRQNKGVQENTEEELDKELERRSRKKRDGSSDKVRYDHSSKEGDERTLSSKSDRAKEERRRYERHRDEEYGDKHLDDGEKGDKHLDDGEKGVKLKDFKYQEDVDKDYKQRDHKHREDNNRDTSRRHDRYDQEVDKDNGRKEDWYYEDDDRYDKHREDKYRAERERDGRRRVDKYREGGERENKLKDENPSEDGGKDRRRNFDRNREDGERHDKQRDNKYREENERSSRSRHKEERYRDVGESRHNDSQREDDPDRGKSLRETKYGDENIYNRAGDKSDAKRSREDNHAADFHPRKSSMRDSSPGYDDHVSRYKDDLGRRRPEDREDISDVRFRSTKDHPTDFEKRSNNNDRVDMTTDRGRSMPRTADVERTSIHSRRRGSPVNSSRSNRDLYRLSKQEEAKHRDYAYDERTRNSVYSGREYVSAAGIEKMSSQPMEVLDLKDENHNHIAELPVERHLKLEAYTSPMKLAHRSPSSVSRQLNRSDIRRSLDAEESTKRSGSWGAKDFSGKGGKGSEFPMEMLPGDEFSQADGDTLSVSSPVVRSNYRSGTPRSLLPPPHARSSSDGPSMFGSYEDDNRNKSNHRYWRSTDSNMGRMQGNAWKGVPNWPSHTPNGFMPFQHGPPPVGFHPAMHQFATPPVFGVRPSMDLSHPLVPYHLPNAERFSGHGPAVGWQNPVDDPCPPPVHGWEANHNIFSDESHLFARSDWERNKNLSGARGREIGGDTLKRPNRGSSVELTPAAEKEHYSARSPVENSLSGRSIQQSQCEQPDLQADSTIAQSDDASARALVEHSKTTRKETSIDSKQSIKDDSLGQFYLSKLDISSELTESDLYDQFAGLMSLNENMTIDVDDSNFLYLEGSVDSKLPAQNKTISSSFFSATNDSVLKKAMSLYIKEREHISKGNRVQFSSLKDPILATNEEKLDPKVGHTEFFTSNGSGHGADDTPQILEQEVELVGPQKVEGPLLLPLPQEIKEPDINVSVKQEEAALPVCMDVDLAPNVEVEVEAEATGEVHLASPENVEPVVKVEEITTSGDTAGEVKLLDTKSGPSLFSNMSSEACEANVPESDDQSGSIIVSRIHHSPESTH